MDEKGSFPFTVKTNSLGEAYLAEISRDLFAKFDSQTIFQQHFGHTPIEPDSFYIFYGTDSGLLLSYLLSSSLPETSRIIIIEDKRIINWILHNSKELNLPDNLALIPRSNFEQQLNQFGINGYILQDRLFFVPSLSLQYRFYEPYIAESEQIMEYIKTLHWNIRINLDQKDFIVGHLQNVADNVSPHRKLYNNYKGLTAVLLAGGPSLDDILPWVKSNRKKIVVFAVSRVAKQLRASGISPDFFISVHTQDISFSVSKEMLYFQDDSILISHAQACPKLIGQWHGKHFFMGHIFPWESILNGPDKDLVGPTVSHAAYDVIVKFGFKRILLGGVDLCFSTAQKSHASGSLEAEKTTQSEGGDVRVETNSGQLAETTFAFQRGILEFSKLAKAAQKRGCKTYTAAVNAARIPNVELIQLRKFKLDKKNTRLKITDNSPQKIEERKRHLFAVIDELKQAHQCILNMRTSAREMFDLLSASRKEDDTSSNPDLSQFEETIGYFQNKQNLNIYTTLNNYGIQYFNSLNKPSISGDRDINLLLKHYRLFFTAVIFSADKLGYEVLEGIKRTENRLEELKENGDIDALLDRWAKDNQPSRALNYLSVYEEKELTQNQRARFDELKRLFEESMQDESSSDSIISAITDWDENRLAKLRGRIFQAFSSSDLSQLNSIVHSLQDHGAAEINSHLLLAKGLVHEIQMNRDLAFSVYNEIIEMGGDANRIILEDALNRVASIALSMNDLENANLALQCLTDLSFGHAPTYAEFLYLTGQKEQALELYAEYMGKFPNDLKTMLKLGLIYKDMNLKEGVAMVVDYVLEREPTNQTAVELKKFISQ